MPLPLKAFSLSITSAHKEPLKKPHPTNKNKTKNTKASAFPFFIWKKKNLPLKTNPSGDESGTSMK